MSILFSLSSVHTVCAYCAYPKLITHTYVTFCANDVSTHSELHVVWYWVAALIEKVTKFSLRLCATLTAVRYKQTLLESKLNCFVLVLLVYKPFGTKVLNGIARCQLNMIVTFHCFLSSFEMKKIYMIQNPVFAFPQFLISRIDIFSGDEIKILWWRFISSFWLFFSFVVVFADLFLYLTKQDYFTVKRILSYCSPPNSR